ncbi:unnamed protein product [Caenorhabditis brenneri]
MDVFNFIRNHYLALLLVCLTSFLTKLCGRKTRRQDKIKPSNEDQPHPPSDPNYDETQENIQTVEVQEDPLANVRLLTPTLPGGCNDENAAKEAATRHKTNQYFPKLQIQKRRIVNRTTKSELRKMVDQLPPHPPQRYRTELREPALDKRKEKWKNAHVHWHDTGLVFIVRSHDPCRSKDDNGGDTIDSPSKEEQQESTKINSEMPLSDKNAERKSKAKSRRSKEKTPAPLPQSSKKSSKERKLAPTQEETQLSDETKATSVGVTPKTSGIPSSGAPSGIVTTGPESVKSVNL